MSAVDHGHLTGNSFMSGETQLNQSQFRKLSAIVYRESGVVLNDKKFSLLCARVAKRMRATGISRVSDYIELVCNNPGEFSEFIDATTTNHTFFFRENKHIEYIIANCSIHKKLKIWSAASSSGEEAFSIAVQLLENFFLFSVLGSDISDSMLEIAQKAVYPVDKVKDVPDPVLHKYFKKGINKWNNYVKVKDFVRQYVRFEKFNLLSDTQSESFDIIFCRNVMIYFDHGTRQKVVNNLIKALNPGGLLFVGMSESLYQLEHDLVPVTASGYQKK